MPAASLPSDPLALERLEHRARRYRDPVQRLRFLRRATEVRRPVRPSGQVRVRRGWLKVLPVLLLLEAGAGGRGSGPVAQLRVATPHPVAKASISASRTGQARDQGLSAAVWLVEQTEQYELYSNGLRVDRTRRVAGTPRRPRWMPRDGLARGEPPDPAGIVFHASENDPVPFAPEYNRHLRRQGENLLEWVRRGRLYHYLIDRFGQVYRILEDGDRAEHAGHSIWADDEWVYLELNESFLGVCFEARTAGVERVDLSAAQRRAGKALIEMLLSRFGILPGNCVTHAQASVNPGNGLIGYHTDWADGFPFAELGLPDNYRLAPPSLILYGFQADSLLVRRAAAPLREAIRAAERALGERAQEQGEPLETHRRRLQTRYRQALQQSALWKESIS